MGGAFTHRFNRDSTVDSICHVCFRTVCTATREADLEAVEQRHVCGPNDKLRYDVLSGEGELVWDRPFELS